MLLIVLIEISAFYCLFHHHISTNMLLTDQKTYHF